MNNKLIIRLIVFVLLITPAACKQHAADNEATETKAETIDTTALPANGADKKDNTNVAITDSINKIIPDTEYPSFIENFTGAKGDYTAGTVIFNTGNWYMADALIGKSSEDVSGDKAAVRIRNSGKLSMQFDVTDIKAVTVSYALYGNDQPCSWQLWLSKDGGSHYNQTSATIKAASHILEKTTFTMNQRGKLRFEIRKTGGGKNRLNIDDISIYSTDKNSAVNTPPALSPKNNNTTQGGDDNNLLLGNPTNATHSAANGDNYLIDHVHYIESYNKTRCIPNWVSWHIERDDLGHTDRLDNFRPDASLPGGWYEATNTSYKNSGFDKGHNCPSGDRTATADANGSTFFMDNIIPQAPNNNQRTWEHLESYCRDQVKKGNEVYVIMGSYGSGGTGSKGYATSIDNGRINVPSHIWKVVVIIPDGNNDVSRINTNTHVIAVDTPNDNSIAPNWMNYVTTVSAIEKAAGCQLLTALPPNVRTTLENKKFTGGN